MNKDELIEQMLKEKGDNNNTIDLDAYARGLIDMYEFVLSNVDQKRELLLVFKEWYSKNTIAQPIHIKNIENFLNQ